MNCPNINHPDYKVLAKVYGTVVANVLFHRNNDTIPTIKESLLLLYPNKTEVLNALKAWDTGTYSGKNQKQFEPEIDKLILSNPDAKVGGGESFNDVKNRAILQGKRLLDSAPNNSAVVSHSTVLKFLLLWDKMGRPDDLSSITANQYLDMSTKPGEMEKLKGANGDIYFIRHGETEDNEDGNLRTDDTMLTDKGIAQANKIGNQLKNVEIAHIYTSPLPRAVHTSDLILSKQTTTKPYADNSNWSGARETAGGQRYGMEKEWNEEKVTAKDFMARREEMSKAMREKESQGYTVQKMSETTWRWKKETPSSFFQLTTSTEPVDLGLNKQLAAFVKALKGQIRNVSEIVINGKKYDAVAVTDIINKVIEVVEGKVGKDTLPEEVAHLFVEYLPEDSHLLELMMNDIVTRPIYQEVLNEYGSNDLYLNEDGTVNEDKIKKEAIGKMIAKAIVNDFDSKKEKSLWTKFWDKLWSWISSLVNIFKESQEGIVSPYTEAAQDILAGNISKLEMDRIKEADEKGLYYLQLTPEEEEEYNAIYEIATPQQIKTLDFIHKEPHDTIKLEHGDTIHKYTSLVKELADRVNFTSLTKAINGKKNIPKDKQKRGEIARELGNQADALLRAIISNKGPETVDTPLFSDELKTKLYTILQNRLEEELEYDKDGNRDIAISQSIIPYYAPILSNSIAGSADLIIIDPKGNIKKIIDLKTSITSIFEKSAKKTGTKYVVDEYSTGEDSWLQGVNLSKKDTHAMQLSAEQAMLEIRASIEGKKIAFGGLSTFNIHFQIEENENGDIELVDAIDEGTNDIDITTYRGFVDMLLHGAPQKQQTQNEFREPTIEEEAEQTKDMTQEEIDKYYESVQPFKTSFDEILDEMERLSSTRVTSLLPEFSTSVANRFRLLASQIQELREKGERRKAAVLYINTINNFTNNYKRYIQNEDNFDDPAYYLILEETLKMADSNLESVPENLRDLLAEDQKPLLDNLRRNIRDLKTQAVLFANNYVKNVGTTEFSGISDVKDKSGNIVKTKEDIVKEILYGAENDISYTSLMKDAPREMYVQIIGQISLIVEKAKLQSTLNSNELVDKIAQIGKEFEKTTGLKLSDKEVSDFLFKLDKDGTRIRFMEKIGDAYHDEKTKIDALILDKDTGEKMQYIPKPVTKEDFDFNIKLFAIKKVRQAFYNSENIIVGDEQEGEIEITDGEFHHLSEEYKRERQKVMKIRVVNGNATWVPRTEKSTDVNEIEDFEKWSKRTGLDSWKEYWKEKVSDFRNDYEVFREYQSMQKKYVNGELVPTGKIENKKGYFPAFKHVLVNEDQYSYETGEKEVVKSLLNKDYLKLKNATSELDKAKYAYYKAFNDILQDAAKKGGDTCQQWYNDGGLINLPAKFFKTAAKQGLFKQLSFNMKEWFTAVPKGTIRKTDELGTPRQELVVPYMANLRNAQRIEKLENDLKELEKNKVAGTVNTQKYEKQKDILVKQLTVENHKTDARDIETDPTKLLQFFTMGVEKYAEFSKIEGKLLALRDVVSQKISDEEGKTKQFYLTGNKGQQIIRSGAQDQLVYKKKEQINAIKKVNDFLNLFYGDSYSKGTLDVIADRIMNITSFGAMGFNYMGHFKNVLLYEASNFRQNIAERFVTRDNYTKAKKEFFTEYMAGMSTKIFEKKSGPFKATSKLEWMMHNFGLDADAQLKAQGKASGSGFLDKTYAGENFAIHQAQYTMQSAYLRGLFLKDANGDFIKDKDGNNISMYDAYVWNPNTKKCELRDECKNTIEQQKFAIITAKDIQTKTQGNFDELNKPMLKNYLLGRLVSQFHNFFATAWNDRFDKKYTHATLGEIEGTWTSVISYGKLLKEFEGHWYDKLKNGWGALSDMQKKNLKTDLAELMMVSFFIIMAAIIRGFAKKVPEDDPNMKRLLNFLAYTSSAVGKEQSTFTPGFGVMPMLELIENPMAISPVVKGLWDAVSLSVEFPFQSEKERYYQRGVFKGKGKAAENWRKILPIYKQLHRWSNYIQESDFDVSHQKK
jgi:broad specificity phosphatase PhoE